MLNALLMLCDKHQLYYLVAEQTSLKTVIEIEVLFAGMFVNEARALKEV